MKRNNLPPIGMRNIKTALSVFVCVVVFGLMGPDFNPLFASIAAVIATGPSIEDSVVTGWNRILGTLMGGITGLIGIFICNLIPFSQIYLFIIPIGVMGIIYLFNHTNRSGAIIIACVMYISVMITYPQELGSYLIAVIRLLETGFGIIVAVLINGLIKVPDETKQAIAEKDDSPSQPPMKIETAKDTGKKNKKLRKTKTFPNYISMIFNS